MVSEVSRPGNASSAKYVGLIFSSRLRNIKNEVEGMAWLYVASANGDEGAAKLVTSGEEHFNETIISAARARATEMQAQITSRAAHAGDDSTASTLQGADHGVNVP